MEPYIPPWSVSASASMPPALVASISRLMRDWPSSRLYSEWTCRWVKSATENHHPSRYRVSTVSMLGLVRREDDGARAEASLCAVDIHASLLVHMYRRSGTLRG